MRLKQLLAFSLVVVILGAGWWWYPQRQRHQVQSIPLDESLNAAQSAESTSVGPQGEALWARFLAPPGPGLTNLPVEEFQPPFLRSACYLSAVDTCLVSIYEYEGTGRHIVRRGNNPKSKFLDKPELTFALGRILGEPDRVRTLLVGEDGSLATYFAFVRYLREVSLENHVNPAVVYSLYDYLLLTAQQSGRPLTILPHPQQLTAQINTSLSTFKRGEKPGDTIGSQFSSLESWSAEDKALAAGLARSLSDSKLLAHLLSQPGGFDLHYNDRIQGSFDNKPFKASFSDPDITNESYRQGKQVSGEIAACRSGRAALCHLAGPESDGLWQLDCRWAPLLNEFCDGSLPVL